MFYVGFKAGNCSEEKTSCFVSFANMSSVPVQFPIPVNINLSKLMQKMLIIERHIKMRDDVLYKCVIDENTSSAIQLIE